MSDFDADFFINQTGTEVNIKDIPSIEGLDFLDLTVAAPALTASYQTNSGIDGELDLGATYGVRQLQTNFYFNGTGIDDFNQKVHALYQVLMQRDPYYIRSSLMPNIRYFVRPEPYTSTRVSSSEMTFTVTYDLIKGFGESVNPLSSTFTMDSFTVNNPSAVVIDPRQHHFFQIILTNTAGIPVITNMTTGDIFQLNATLVTTDTLLIDGIYPYQNGNHIGRNTNHGIITLAKGDNNFTITGCTSVNAELTFTALYL